MDHVDIALPHIARETLNDRGTFFSPPLEESTKRVFISVSPSPDESFPLQIINIDNHDKAILEGEMGEILERETWYQGLL